VQFFSSKAGLKKMFNEVTHFKAKESPNILEEAFIHKYILQTVLKFQMVLIIWIKF